MSTQKVSFKNAQGLELSANVDLPDHIKAHNYALFAHCFTCSKNLTAVRNISRALNNAGIAVLRFDFTGLGDSDGDFSDTSFSSNVSDLVMAAEFMNNEFGAPSLMIGHSLGGAAVIFAVAEIPSVKAVVTIGAPSSPSHVERLLKDGLDDILKEGKSVVNIGGRPFQLSSDFVHDIRSKNMAAVLKTLSKPLLVLHSPQDTTVGIKNAEEIYHYARHPKSYVSLDGADHLLSKKVDSQYVGQVISGWVQRYIDVPKSKNIQTRSQVAVMIGNDGYTSQILAGKHLLIADEPESVGGSDFGPSPYEYLSASLGACTAMTLRMYADRKKWPLEKVIVHLDHKKDYPEASDSIEPDSQKIDVISRIIDMAGSLDETQIKRLMEIADRCPVHRTLSGSVKIETALGKLNEGIEV